MDMDLARLHEVERARDGALAHDLIAAHVDDAAQREGERRGEAAVGRLEDVQRREDARRLVPANGLPQRLRQLGEDLLLVKGALLERRIERGA